MTPRRRRCEWGIGDLFAVPLIDGTYGFGQVAGLMMPNAPYVSLYRARRSDLQDVYSPVRRDLIALLSTTADLLDNGMWPVRERAPLVASVNEFPNEQFAASGYIGAKTYGSGIVMNFLGAFHGLLPWNALVDEAYHDGMLAPGVDRPETVHVLSDAERKTYRQQSGWE